MSLFAGLTRPAAGMPPPVSILLANLLLLIPALAIVLKRLNDRGYAPWVVGLWLVPNLAVLLATQTGLVGVLKSWGLGGIALVVTVALVLIWFFIDLGFLRGQRGPNRYGPDPLGAADTDLSHPAAPSAKISAMVSSASSRWLFCSPSAVKAATWSTSSALPPS